MDTHSSGRLYEDDDVPPSANETMDQFHSTFQELDAPSTSSKTRKKCPSVSSISISKDDYAATDDVYHKQTKGE